jgi:hypothetical protein
MAPVAKSALDAAILSLLSSGDLYTREICRRLNPHAYEFKARFGNRPRTISGNFDVDYRDIWYALKRLGKEGKIEAKDGITLIKTKHGWLTKRVKYFSLLKEEPRWTERAASKTSRGRSAA